jgi:hypothetical protein
MPRCQTSKPDAIPKTARGDSQNPLASGLVGEVVDGAAAVRNNASASPGFGGSSAAGADWGAGRSPSSRRVIPADWTPTAARALTRTPTPAIQWMCQNPATTPTKAQAWAVALATATMRELVLRRRNISCRLTSTRAARSGIATAKATAQIIPAGSREPPATNGCIRTMPIAINPP